MFDRSCECSSFDTLTRFTSLVNGALRCSLQYLLFLLLWIIAHLPRSFDRCHLVRYFRSGCAAVNCAFGSERRELSLIRPWPPVGCPQYHNSLSVAKPTFTGICRSKVLPVGDGTTALLLPYIVLPKRSELSQTKRNRSPSTASLVFGTERPRNRHETRHSGRLVNAELSVEPTPCRFVLVPGSPPDSGLARFDNGKTAPGLRFRCFESLCLRRPVQDRTGVF